jgi:rSAM/selenodomain-associated transferase 1
VNVLIFAKAPRRGRVKTRLALEIGKDAALQVYREMGKRIVDGLRGSFSITVYFDPPEAEAEIQEWLGDVGCRPQTDGDLGDRMSAAIDEHFALKPGQPLVVIGADAPDVDAGVIKSAKRALKEHPVVIGPSVDGGYYLIGLRAPVPELFQEIPWSSDKVFLRTLEKCRALGIRPDILQILRDVDTAADARNVGVL